MARPPVRWWRCRSAEAVVEHLSPGLDIATVNDPGSCVIAGTAEDILKFQNRLRQNGITARRVRTSHAFHWSLMEPVVGEFADLLARVELHKPHTPLLSNSRWMTNDEATDPAMWARQIRATICHVADELDLMLDNPFRVLVEVGPGGTLTGTRGAPSEVVDNAPRRSSPHAAPGAEPQDDRDTFLLALGRWAAGVDVDWSPLSWRKPRRVSLPGYPFARQKHWVEPQEDGLDGRNCSRCSRSLFQWGRGSWQPAERDQSEIETTLPTHLRGMPRGAISWAQ